VFFFWQNEIQTIFSLVDKSDYFVLQHQFVARLNVRTILLDLIIRTKNAVRDLDNINYRSSLLKKYTKINVSDPL
jgi:hypothetical protein